jgi:predicted negative regulator of RcsB-dependent stress response
VAQHISRKELKKDEVRDTLTHGIEEVLIHGKSIAYTVLVLAAVALVVFGWRFYTERQTVRASVAFDDAMKSFQARIRTAGEPVDGADVTYADEKTKWTDAARKFGEVAMTYPRTRPGQLSHYYAALSLEHLGNDAGARNWLEGLAGSNENFAAMAKFELAQIDDRTGKPDDAVKLYQELIAKPSVLVPKPVVMLALAEHYRASNVGEATKLYNQIKTEYPDTAISEQADQELALLPGKS